MNHYCKLTVYQLTTVDDCFTQRTCHNKSWIFHQKLLLFQLIYMSIWSSGEWHYARLMRTVNQNDSGAKMALYSKLLSLRRINTSNWWQFDNSRNGGNYTHGSVCIQSIHESFTYCALYNAIHFIEQIILSIYKCAGR